MSGRLFCDYKSEECCFRNTFGCCNILRDTRFNDGECHFRKKTPDGENLYDLKRKCKEESAG